MAGKHPAPDLVAFVLACEHKADCVKVGLELPAACETCILFRERGKESLKEVAEAAMLLRYWIAISSQKTPNEIRDNPGWPGRHEHNYSDRHLWEKIPLLPEREET